MVFDLQGIGWGMPKSWELSGKTIDSFLGREPALNLQCFRGPGRAQLIGIPQDMDRFSVSKKKKWMGPYQRTPK